MDSVSSDNQSDTGTPEGQPEPVNVGGNIRDLFALKKNNRHIKILLSIGGYTSSQEGQFKGAVKDDASRKRFATSAVRIMKDWGFDGLDIDWEYPTNASEAEQLRLLLRECRIALDSYADRNDQSYRMLLTIATSAAKSTYGVLNLPAIDKFVDLWFLMAYDYTGSWSTSSGHHAALYKDSSNMKATPVNTDDTVKDYISKGVPSRKIVLGIPTYGRGFGSTVKGFGKDFKGNGGQDAFLYKDLPFKGTNTESGTNTKVVAAWTWDPAKKIMVSYDNPSTVATKAKYARDKNLGGVMFWDAAGDKAGDQSLVRAAKNNLGTLDRSNNLLEFKNSRYQNIRDKTAR